MLFLPVCLLKSDLYCLWDNCSQHRCICLLKGPHFTHAQWIQHCIYGGFYTPTCLHTSAIFIFFREIVKMLQLFFSFPPQVQIIQGTTRCIFVQIKKNISKVKHICDWAGLSATQWSLITCSWAPSPLWCVIPLKQCLLQPNEWRNIYQFYSFISINTQSYVPLDNTLACTCSHTPCSENPSVHTICLSSSLMVFAVFTCVALTFTQRLQPTPYREKHITLNIRRQWITF